MGAFRSIHDGNGKGKRGVYGKMYGGQTMGFCEATTNVELVILTRKPELDAPANSHPLCGRMNFGNYSWTLETWQGFVAWISRAAA
jgi:hypothetical protein